MRHYSRIVLLRALISALGRQRVTILMILAVFSNFVAKVRAGVQLHSCVHPDETKGIIRIELPR